MSVSPRRISKTRKKIRNSHSSLSPINLAVCLNCSRHVKFHSVCSCGYYRGIQVIKRK